MGISHLAYAVIGTVGGCLATLNALGLAPRPFHRMRNVGILLLVFGYLAGLLASQGL